MTDFFTGTPSDVSCVPNLDGFAIDICAWYHVFTFCFSIVEHKNIKIFQWAFSENGAKRHTLSKRISVLASNRRETVANNFQDKLTSILRDRCFYCQLEKDNILSEKAKNNQWQNSSKVESTICDFAEDIIMRGANVISRVAYNAPKNEVCFFHQINEERPNMLNMGCVAHSLNSLTVTCVRERSGSWACVFST